jgi:hypothetical protein
MCSDVLVGELLHLVLADAHLGLGEPSAFSILSMASLVERRILRMATRPSSIRLRTCLDSSSRRSSVSDGISRRMMLPSLVGIRPSSEVMIAFSIAERAFLSHGVIPSRRVSMTWIEAIWLTGTFVP